MTPRSLYYTDLWLRPSVTSLLATPMQHRAYSNHILLIGLPIWDDSYLTFSLSPPHQNTVVSQPHTPKHYLHLGCCWDGLGGRAALVSAIVLAMRLMYSGASCTSGLNVHSSYCVASASKACCLALSAWIACSLWTRSTYVSGSSSTLILPCLWRLFSLIWGAN